jgi:hypothetical protein
MPDMGGGVPVKCVLCAKWLCASTAHKKRSRVYPGLYTVAWEREREQRGMWEQLRAANCTHMNKQAEKLGIQYWAGGGGGRWWRGGG